MVNASYAEASHQDYICGTPHLTWGSILKMSGKAMYATGATSAALVVDAGGQTVHVLPILIGLLAVALTRMVSTAKETSRGWDYYNVCVTLLLMLILVTLIIDRNLGPGMAMFWGVGIGASGVLIIDILGERARAAIRIMFGKHR